VGKAAGRTPGTDYQRRLRLAHRLWKLIAGRESDHVALSWFIAGNPLLDEDTRITAIAKTAARTSWGGRGSRA